MGELSISIPPTPVEGERGDAPALGGARALRVVVDTFAGDGTRGHADGPAATARFTYPRGLAVDAVGTVYVADWEGHRIRRITSDGTVSTLAGDGVAGFADGPGAVARFHFPRDVAVDAAGNVYVADTDNHRIRKITPAGMVTTLTGEGTYGFADGPRGTARFYNPNGVAVDAAGVDYVADASNARVRKVTPGGRSPRWRATRSGASPTPSGTRRGFTPRGPLPWIGPAGCSSPTTATAVFG